MKHVRFSDVLLEDVNVDGAKNAKIRWLISNKDGAERFSMRMFEVAPEGNTPYHIHDFEHEIFVLDGQGMLVTENGESPMKPWDVIYVDPNLMHQFKNTGDKPLIFLCSIPNEVKKVPKRNPFGGGKINNC